MPDGIFISVKKIVIIGANSYIARNVLYLLRSDKNCLLRLYGHTTEHIDHDPDYMCVDILSREAVRQMDLDCDVIFMFAGKTGSMDGFTNYNIFLDVNERGLLNVLDEYRSQHSTAKFIFPSSRLVYQGSSIPQKEDAAKELKTVYAMTKYAGEQYLKQYHRVFGLKYCIFRICVPYGTMISGASSYGTIEFMLGKAKGGEDITLYGDGSARRTVIYIKDLCRILIDGAFAPQCVNDVYNIGGEDYSLREMAQLIADRYQVGICFQEWPEAAQAIESGDTVFDDSKLSKSLKCTYHKSFVQWIKEKDV